MKQFKPSEVRIFFEKQGWIKDRQSGSHVIMSGPGGKGRAIIPIHSKDIPTGTLLGLLQQTGYTKQEFLLFWEE